MIIVIMLLIISCLLSNLLCTLKSIITKHVPNAIQYIFWSVIRIFNEHINNRTYIIAIIIWNRETINIDSLQYLRFMLLATISVKNKLFVTRPHYVIFIAQ